MIKIGPVKCFSDPEGNGWDCLEGWDDQGRSELVGFCISYSDCGISAIQFIYAQDGDVVLSARSCSLTDTVVKRVQLDYPSEYLTRVSGKYSTADGVFNCITFGTNKTRYGPFGGTDGQQSSANVYSFDWDWGPQNDFYGFYGKYDSSNTLKGLGVYLKPVLPSQEPALHFVVCK